MSSYFGVFLSLSGNSRPVEGTLDLAVPDGKSFGYTTSFKLGAVGVTSSLKLTCKFAMSSANVDPYKKGLIQIFIHFTHLYYSKLLYMYQGLVDFQIHDTFTYLPFLIFIRQSSFP